MGTHTVLQVAEKCCMMGVSAGCAAAQDHTESQQELVQLIAGSSVGSAVFHEYTGITT